MVLAFVHQFKQIIQGYDAEDEADCMDEIDHDSEPEERWGGHDIGDRRSGVSWDDEFGRKIK
jgi:hypothetical protein